MRLKSPRTKLNLSSSTSSASAAGDAKSVPEVQGMVDEPASTYPSERVRVLGSLERFRDIEIVEERSKAVSV